MMTRGNPQDAIIHLRVPQQRPGMKEGEGFPTHVACHTGKYHIHITNHVTDVTCEKCLEVGRIKAWNQMVDDVIDASQTFSFQTPEGIVNIELGFKGMKEQKYAAWLQHKEDTIVYGETPHEVYSDLIGGSHAD
jgi:hypothetical protein